MPSFAEAFRVWLRWRRSASAVRPARSRSCTGIVVEEKKWIREDRFLHALNYCMLLPGPEAQQLATYIGWLMHRTLGGLMAGVLFVLPGVVAMLALSIIYAVSASVPSSRRCSSGSRRRCSPIVVEAVLRIGKRVLKNSAMFALAASAFVGHLLLLRARFR